MIKRFFKWLFAPKPGYYFNGKRVTIVEVEAIDYQEQNIYRVRFEDGHEDIIHEILLQKK